MTSTTNRTIPWWQPEMGRREYDLVREVLDSNYVNDGPVTRKFENAVAELVGARFAVAVTSGTMAIYLSLKSLGVGPGDEVIVPDITFIATANAVEMTGAKPVIVDVDPNELSLGAEACRAHISSNTRAIIPVHVSGRGGTLPAILEIGREFGIPIVEDAAEALLSKFRGTYLGTWGRLGCISLSPNKTITAGQGGVIFTDDEELYSRLRELKDQGRPTGGSGFDDVHERTGYNFKFTSLQAAVALGQLELLPHRVERLKRINDIYRQELAVVSEIRLMNVDTAGGECPQWTDALAEKRDELYTSLNEKEINCRRFWFPLHTQKPYKGRDEDYPVAMDSWSRALWLPSAFQLTDDDVRYVAEHIRKFYGY